MTSMSQVAFDMGCWPL